jgi:mycothiol synthase
MMQSAVVTTRLTRDDVPAVDRLITVAQHNRGYRPVSDQFLLDLHDADGPPTLSARYFDHEGVLIAYAQAAQTNSSMTIESVTCDDGQVAGGALAAVLDAVLDGVLDGDRDATCDPTLVWLVQGPTAQHDALAASRHFVLDRQLHQMRRSLPTGIDFQINTRAFDPDRDVTSWLSVNARAFAWNPEQGSWTADSLHDRMREPWFDRSGFRIHERDGRMAGFCWTKVHDEEVPPIGEIYVIAVDPDFHGLGIGRDLTLAGLDHLARSGIQTGMLFVDSHNVAALRVYQRLGFVVQRTDSMFVRHL